MNIANEWQSQLAESPLSPSGVLSRAAGVQELQDFDFVGQRVFAFNSRDRRSRPFNLLRSQVLKTLADGERKIIGITSATPSVGKSFLASNLAASLSRIPDLRVLLLDLDLRRGSVAEIFNIAEGQGINTYLEGKIDTLTPTAYDVPGTGLTVFPAFNSRISSAELLAGSRLRTLVEAVRALDDVICICDLPPAFANDDASIVLREIDGYIFVVEEGKTTARQVVDALNVLKPATCLGTVLNRYRGGIGGDDYGFGYGTQRSYDAYYS